MRYNIEDQKERDNFFKSLKSRLEECKNEHRNVQELYNAYHNEHPNLAYSENGEDTVSVGYALRLCDLEIEIEHLEKDIKDNE